MVTLPELYAAEPVGALTRAERRKPNIFQTAVMRVLTKTVFPNPAIPMTVILIGVNSDGCVAYVFIASMMYAATLC